MNSASTAHTRWYLTAACGHVLEPEPSCEEEANPATAWCGKCEDWAFFNDAHFERSDGEWVLMIDAQP